MKPLTRVSNSNTYMVTELLTPDKTCKPPNSLLNVSFYTSDSDKVVYMTSALGIILKKSDNTQQFFGGGETKACLGHNDDITSLAISPDRKKVVTGQRGKIPLICVWKATSGERISQFSQDRNTRSVKACAFNRTGDYIGTVGDNDQHSVFVFDCQGTKLAMTKVIIEL